jgi:hypothetical protein
VDPHAITVMAEIGIDIRAAHNKSTAEAVKIVGGRVDLSVTMCAEGSEDCPYLPGAKAHCHHAFDDPPHMAEHAGASDPLPFYRTVRDQIGVFVRTRLPQQIPGFAPRVNVDVNDDDDVDISSSGTAPLLADESGTGTRPKVKPQISFFEKYLTVWVALCMVFGALLGYYVPGIARGFAKAEFYHIV